MDGRLEVLVDGCSEGQTERCSAVQEERDLEGQVEWLQEGFADDLFKRPVEKTKMTRMQKREQRRSYGLERAKDRRVLKRQPLSKDLGISAEELRQMQESDVTLVKAAEGMEFFKQDGILYWRWVPRGKPEEAGVNQIVLPRECRKAVLQLAHSVPLGGHLGKKKMAARIMQWFYWPSLFRDVAEFCRSCTQCQRAGHWRVARVPMVPLPVVEEPFQRIAMDIVGPLPCSRAGHRYMLVVCDYGTQYPEAVPTKTIKCRV